MAPCPAMKVDEGCMEAVGARRSAPLLNFLRGREAEAVECVD